MRTSLAILLAACALVIGSATTHAAATDAESVSPSEAGDARPLSEDGALVRGLAAHAAGDFARAARLLYPLALDGVALAQRLVGNMHRQGQFFEQDACVAIVWYDRAARNGDPTSMHYLANAYGSGKGLRQNQILAYLWASSAEELGERGAWTARRVALLMMTDAQRAEAIRRLAEFVPSAQPPVEFYPVPQIWSEDDEMLRRLAERKLTACRRAF